MAAKKPTHYAITLKRPFTTGAGLVVPAGEVIVAAPICEEIERAEGDHLDGKPRPAEA